MGSNSSLTMNIAMVLVLAVFAVSSALDMSIISYDNAHADHKADEEVMSMYEEWLEKHGKVYKAVGEKEKRFQIFKDNLRFIEERNSLKRSYKLGLNNFADLTNAEYKAKYLGGARVNPGLDLDRNLTNLYMPRVGDTLPESVDWREEGAVTPVKSQGATCNSCWAFTANGAVESLIKIVKGDLVSLSEQEMVDCIPSSSQGCGGGYIQDAFNYIKRSGISSENDYPYTGVAGTCDQNKINPVVSIDNYGFVPALVEAALKQAVANQPVSVAVSADDDEFQYYVSGVFHGNCGTELNHALLIVGYGTDGGEDYWLAKNSYSSLWGENGYIRIKRKLSTCKFGPAAYYPIIN